MKWTRKWGYVSSREELAMLNRAERHLKQKKKPTYSRSTPAINLGVKNIER